MDIALRILTDALFIALLIWCAYTDIRTRTVSNTAVILLLCLGLAHTVLIRLSGSVWWPYPVGLALAVPFFIVWLKGGMGAGDVKLLMGIGLYLGLLNTMACIIFSVFAASPPAVDESAAAVTQVWSYVGELIFNMLVLVGTVKMADRVVREMMGL